MSSRFHNKYHRHNHHTQSVNDPRYPDASHDPIASPDSPFLGPFVLSGQLSANSSSGAAGAFYTPSVSTVAVFAHGSLQATGSIEVTGTATVSDIAFTGNVLNTYTVPLITTAEFLQIVVNGVTRYIRLWDFYTPESGTFTSGVLEPQVSAIELPVPPINT